MSQQIIVKNINIRKPLNKLVNGVQNIGNGVQNIGNGDRFNN